MDKVLERLSLAVRDARNRENITQKELAVKVKISSHHLAGIESGREKPSCFVMCSLIQNLDLSAQMIIHPKAFHSEGKIRELIVLMHDCNEAELAIFSKLLISSQSSSKTDFEQITKMVI
ncbi:MAG: helix-turn-helix domain-containing protein [Oscillospiraceae bacterium]|nr:helix-turn-helix domain-containing protein [Oscillospiraceae bacterium]